jgi:protein-disulfide isomerase
MTKYLNQRSIHRLLLAAGLAAAAVSACSRKPEPDSAAVAQPTLDALIAAAPRFKVPVSATQPSLGDSDALVTVVEWGDFRSSGSRTAAEALKTAMQKYGKDLRIVHRILPNEQDPESLATNEFARAAFETGKKFWEARERLLAVPSGTRVEMANLEAISKDLGLDWNRIVAGMKSKAFAFYIVSDMQFAKIYGVTKLPTLFVNGTRIPDVAEAQLATTIDAFVAHELANARTVAASGVARTEVYDTIVAAGKWSLTDDPTKRQSAQSAPQAAPTKAM